MNNTVLIPTIYQYITSINFLDSKTALQIWLLTSVVAPKSSKIIFKIGNKKRMWKPTISESQEGILVHCKVS